MVQPPWKTLWRFLRKVKIELLYEPAIAILGICTDKTIIQKDICTPKCLATPFTIAGNTLFPGHGNNINVHQQMNGIRKCGTYIQWNTLISHKKNEMMPFAATAI